MHIETSELEEWARMKLRSIEANYPEVSTERKEVGFVKELNRKINEHALLQLAVKFERPLMGMVEGEVTELKPDAFVGDILGMLFCLFMLHDIDINKALNEYIESDKAAKPHTYDEVST